MAETEQKHRHRWENTALTFEFVYATLGLVLGFIIGLALLCGAYLSGVAGHSVVATAFLTATAISMVQGFINGRTLFTLMFSSTHDDASDSPKTPAKAPEPPVKRSGKSGNKRK